MGEPTARGGERSVEGGLWVAMSLAMAHGTIWVVPYCRNARSYFKNHHSETCNTTSASRSIDVAPGIPPPPPGRVVMVRAPQNGVAAVHDIGAHSTQCNPELPRVGECRVQVPLLTEVVIGWASGLAAMQAISPGIFRGL